MAQTMTMAQMDEYIENKCFLVDRTYIPSKSEYEFKISDGEFTKKYYWKYDRRTDVKIKALDSMLSDFVESKERYNMRKLFESGFASPYGRLILEHGYEYVMDSSISSKTIEYFKEDVMATQNLHDKINSFTIPELNNFNDPMTIVIWSDGTKTIVKARDEAFDREKGLAMAISKKFLGNKYNYSKEFKKWLE